MDCRFKTKKSRTLRSHLNEKHQSLSHSLRIFFNIVIFAWGNYLGVPSHRISPVIKRSRSRIDNIAHSSNFESTHSKFLVTSSYFLHDLSYPLLNFIIYSSTIPLMSVSAPVETNLATSIVKNNSQIKGISPEEVIKDESSICVVAVVVTVHWKISIGILSGRMGHPLIKLETWRISNREIDNMPSLKIFISIEQSMRSQILVSMHSSH